MKLCVVCGNHMSSKGDVVYLEDDVKKMKPIAVTYRGKSFFVCSTDCQNEFNSNPKEYVNNSVDISQDYVPLPPGSIK
jgi:YHS domain-containing protein